MKKHSQEPLNLQPCRPETLNTPPKARIGYVGFDPIEGGRRLRFLVKAAGQEAMEVTLDIASAAFTNKPEISLQDAAPMAYEKITELLAAEGGLDPCELCLTDRDITQYRTRHRTAQKHTTFSHRGREKDLAA